MEGRYRTSGRRKKNSFEKPQVINVRPTKNNSKYSTRNMKPTKCDTSASSQILQIASPCISSGRPQYNQHFPRKTILKKDPSKILGSFFNFSCSSRYFALRYTTEDPAVSQILHTESFRSDTGRAQSKK